jgi:hypothetical protein
MIISHADLLGIKGVRLDDIGARFQVFPVDTFDDGRLRQDQQVIVALQVGRPVFETFAAIIPLFQLMPLDHGSHRSVDDQDTFFQAILNTFTYVHTILLFFRKILSGTKTLLGEKNFLKLLITREITDGGREGVISDVY